MFRHTPEGEQDVMDIGAHSMPIDPVPATAHMIGIHWNIIGSIPREVDNVRGTVSHHQDTPDGFC